MPRPERPLNPSQNPVHAFAAELRMLRDRAGQPKYLQMARATGRSRTSLAEAAGGDHLPTWETVAAFVRACRGDENEWRIRWEQAGALVEHVRGAGATPRPEPDDRILPRSRRWWWRLAATATLTTAVTVPTTAFVVHAIGDDGPLAHAPTPGTVTEPVLIEVQNKVALGADKLLEDRGPAYLSAVPEPYCASQGCRLADTDVWSGALLVATCQTHGAFMVNYNLDSSEVRDNPHRVASTLWYLAVWPDGREGFISEVYLTSASRGGLGLPVCATRTPPPPT